MRLIPIDVDRLPPTPTNKENEIDNVFERNSRNQADSNFDICMNK